jgi:protein-tyrosine-phosphatase
VIDRAVHPFRRLRAIAELRSRQPPASILVVCQGNLCRSPYAAAALIAAFAKTAAAIRVESAGFSTPNRQPPQDAISAAARRGIDITAHRSRMVNPELVAAFDLVVVMDAGLRRAVTVRRPPKWLLTLGDLDPHGIQTRDIVDPIGADAAVFDACYARIDRCIEQLSSALTAPR